MDPLVIINDTDDNDAAFHQQLEEMVSGELGEAFRALLKLAVPLPPTPPTSLRRKRPRSAPPPYLHNLHQLANHSVLTNLALLQEMCLQDGGVMLHPLSTSPPPATLPPCSSSSLSLQIQLTRAELSSLQHRRAALESALTASGDDDGHLLVSSALSLSEQLTPLPRRRLQRVRLRIQQLTRAAECAASGLCPSSSSPAVLAQLHHRLLLHAASITD